MHVINQPDSLGLACNFQFNGQQCITTNTWNLPNMVNYKLGALVGSGCDTVVATTSPQTPEGGLKDRIQVYPNPANEYFVIENFFYDSHEFSFWGSEQYKNNISLHNNPESYLEKKTFSDEQMEEWRTRIVAMNKKGESDNIAIYLKK